MPQQLLETYLQGADISGDLSAELLLTESNHRIANNLALIAGLVHLQAKQVAAMQEALSLEAVTALLKQTAARIDTVAKLHRLLGAAGSSDAVDLSSYLRSVAEAVMSSMTSPGEVRLVLDLGFNVRMTPERALSVALVVGELLTNAVKHTRSAGEPSEVRLRLQRWADGMAMIEVADNGPGLPEGFDPASGGSVGMRLLRTLAKQHDAKLIFAQSRPGLMVQYLLPIASPDE